MTNTQPQGQSVGPEMSWWDRAISKSEMISNGFEVFKAWLARFAEWILFFCLIGNILEIFRLPEPFATVFGNIVLGVQVVTLDVAGFGLASMGASARRRGDVSAAKKASGMGWTLISIMMLTVGMVATSIIFPSTKPTVDLVQNALILVRIIVTVLYSHIVHSLRVSGAEHQNRVEELERDLESRRRELAAKQQELSSVQSQLSSVQKQVSSVQQQLDAEREKVSSVQRKLDTEQQRASTLENEVLTGKSDTAGLRRELAAATANAEGLQIRLDAKTRELAAMQGDLSSVIDLRRGLTTAQQAAEEVRGQLDAKVRELGAVQSHLSTAQREVSRLRRELSTAQSSQVSSGQSVRVSSRQKNRATGQEKIVSLDTRRRTTRETAMAVQRLMLETPGITGRDIARRLPCSPTTANEWKNFFDKGGKLEDLFPDMEIVNE